MKIFFISYLMLLLSLASTAQSAFELIFGESEISESIVQTLEHQGYYYALGSKATSSENPHGTKVIYKIRYDGQIIGQAYAPKPDSSYGILFGLPKLNGNILCFGTLAHEPYLTRARYTYVCEISPDLELIWEKMDSILEPHPHARHRLKNMLLTPDNEVILQGVVDTVMYGNNHFIFFAKYDLEGNRLDYRSYFNYVDDNEGSLMLNADNSGFYLFGQLTIEPSVRTWIEFDFEFNYLGSGVLETNYGPFWVPVTASWLSTGNFITANSFSVPGTNDKGLEMRLYSTSMQLLKSTVVYHDKTIRIPERRGMGFVDEKNIWVATWEPIPPSFTGAENIRFFVFDNEINLKGSSTHEGDIRYWLFDLLATSDTSCLVSGFVGENPGISNKYDNYLMKVRLADVVTGVNKQQHKVGSSVEIWPVPVGETLHVKSSSDSELIIMNAKGQLFSTHTIKQGYNLITLSGLSAGIYLIAIRQNENIIETHKIIKQ